MLRKPRYFLPGIPAHIVQRGHSKAPVFFDTADYRAYLNWFAEGADRYDCEIHAYVLMLNHIHILATPGRKDSISYLMQYIGRHFVPFINHQYGTSGSIWEGRYKKNKAAKFQATNINRTEYVLLLESIRASQREKGQNK